MQFLVFLSFVSVVRFSAASPLLGDGDNTNLFVDSDAYPLFSDDVNGLSANYADPTLDQVSVADENSNTFDWTDSVELAGVDDFCAADSEIQTIGKIRARDEHPSCRSSGQNVNLLNIPNILDVFRKGKKPSVQPGSEIENPLPIDPLAPPEENICPPPYTQHLCCAEPGPNSLNIINGEKFQNTMEGCTPGTSPPFTPYYFISINFRAALGPGACQFQYEVCCSSYFVWNLFFPPPPPPSLSFAKIIKFFLTWAHIAGFRLWSCLPRYTRRSTWSSRLSPTRQDMMGTKSFFLSFCLFVRFSHDGLEGVYFCREQRARGTENSRFVRWEEERRGEEEGYI